MRGGGEGEGGAQGHRALPDSAGPRPQTHHVAAPQRVWPQLGHRDAEMHLHGSGDDQGQTAWRTVALESGLRPELLLVVEVRGWAGSGAWPRPRPAPPPPLSQVPGGTGDAVRVQRDPVERQSPSGQGHPGGQRPEF